MRPPVVLAFLAVLGYILGPEDTNEMPKESYKQVAIAACKPSRSNPRQSFEPKALSELAESIKQHGIVEPIVVRELETTGTAGEALYEIVAGERRWRAAKQAGLAEVPVLIRQMADLQVLEIQLIENLQREDLHPLEEARGYAQLIKRHGLSSEDIADKIGKSRSSVYAKLKLLDLTDTARDAFLSNKFPFSVALLLARIPTPALQARATKEILAGGDGEAMSFRAAKAHIQANYMLDLREAPFDPADAELVAKAGSCVDCPKRSGNMPDLLGELKSADVCTDPVCFAGKRDALWRRRAAAAREAGQEVLSVGEAKRLWPSGSGKPAGGEYVDLEAPCPGDLKRRTWRTVLGGKAPAPTLAKDPSGTWHELLPAAKARAIARERGAGGEASKDRAEAASRRERAKLVQAVSDHAVRVVCERAEKDAQDTAATGLIVLGLVDAAGDSVLEAARARRLVGANAKSADNARKALRTYIDKGQPAAKLRSLALELVLRDRMDVDPARYADALAVACGLYRVDLKQIEKALGTQAAG